jgi:hypothetical protein
MGRHGCFIAVIIYICGATAARADDLQSLDMKTVAVELQNIEAALDRLNDQVSKIQHDMNEMNKCAALARQSPVTMAELRSTFKPKTGADDGALVEIFKKDTQARVSCGLPTTASEGAGHN